MPYKIKRLNATPADLSPEKHEQCMKVFEIFKMTKPVIRPIERAALVEFVDEFGGEKVISFIERWAMLGYHSIDSLYDLITGKIPSERSNNTNEKIQHNRSTDRAALGEVVSHTRAALPGTVGIDVFLAKHEPKIPKRTHIPKDYFTAARAIDWMTANGKDPENWQDFFYQNGVDQSTGTPLYKLNPNIRQ